MNKGILNEINIVNYINGKTINELNNNISFNLKNLFKRKVIESLPFYAKQYDKGRKPDIVITHNNIFHYISVKLGTSETIHEESIDTFIKFLIQNNISTKTLKTILYFQYGDGTVQGNGIKRYSFAEISYKLEKQIQEANSELNNKDLIIKTAERFLFSGWGKDGISADSIYHGTVDNGCICTREQILKHFKIKDYSFLNNLHIGPFLLSPKARYIDFNDKNPDLRNKISVKWPHMISDLIYISNKYNF